MSPIPRVAVLLVLKFIGLTVWIAPGGITPVIKIYIM
jgi:hypothetical protein